MMIFFDVKKYIESRSASADALSSNKVLRELYRSLDMIDAKASALLTHTSLMFVACSTLFGFSEKGSLERELFIIESAGYLIVAFLLLFCFNVGISLSDKKGIDLLETNARASMFRLNTYRISYCAVIILTIIVLFTIGYKQLF